MLATGAVFTAGISGVAFASTVGLGSSVSALQQLYSATTFGLSTYGAVNNVMVLGGQPLLPAASGASNVNAGADIFDLLRGAGSQGNIISLIFYGFEKTLDYTDNTNKNGGLNNSGGSSTVTSPTTGTKTELKK